MLSAFFSVFLRRAGGVFFAACVLIGGGGKARAQNLLINPGFEAGQAPWVAFGSVGIVINAEHARSGVRGAGVSQRTLPWMGIAYDIKSLLQAGGVGAYVGSAYVRVGAPGMHTVILTYKLTDDRGDSYAAISYRQVPGNQWCRLVGELYYWPIGVVRGAVMYVEGPQAGVGFSVDDAALARDGAEWKVAADARIEAVRKRDAAVTVVDRYGQVLEGCRVQARQVQSEFGFGTAISAVHLENARYTDFIKQNFEWGVPEWECKWHYTGRDVGVQDYSKCDATVAFGRTNGIKMRGHNIFWEVAEFCPPWLAGLDAVALRAAMQAHVSSIVPRYQETLLHWDVNNEMLHGSFFRSRLGEDIWRWMYERARAADPDCLLFVNDYNNIDGQRTDDFMAQIRGLLGAGAPIDGVGLQGHFGARVSPGLVATHLNTFSELEMPLWITEYDSVNADVGQRAENLENLYRLAFSYPAVEGIMMWGFWAGAHWRGGDAALVDLDWTVNAAGERYLSLRREWTTDVQAVRGADDLHRFRGFRGDYQIEVTRPGGITQSAMTTLTRGEGTADFVIVMGVPCVADFNGDGGVDGSDVEAFFVAWSAGNADVDASGGVDGADIAVFFEAWQLGSCG